jgi:hypothetical protein
MYTMVLMVKPKAEPKMHRTTIDLPHALYRATKIQALDEARPFREVVIEALTRYLESVKKGATR